MEIFAPGSAEAIAQYKEEKAARATKKHRRGRSRNVCACGHAENAHTYLEEKAIWSCLAGKTYCACHTLRPVLEAENLRLFMYATDGAGHKHALGRGLSASLAEGRTVSWVMQPNECDGCHVPFADGQARFPIPVANNSIANKTSGLNLIVCQGCLELISGR